MHKRTLHWSYLNFRDIPIDLFLYEDLEEIYLKENYITIIPKWFLNLNTLKFIHLSGNNITNIPDEIDLLENLEFFDISYNQIAVLPESLCQLNKLEYLNVSSNELIELPNCINLMKSLEKLNVSKNQLNSLPIELCECTQLHVLEISDNKNLWHIPERIAYMPSLQMISAERCALLYLPAALSKFIDYLRIFHNNTIKHIPMIYDKFYRNFYQTPNKTLDLPIKTHPKLFWVLEYETSSKLLLPIGTQKIFPVYSIENQISLYDHCLKALENLNRLMPFYKNMMLKYLLPEKYMINHIKNGPIARCTVFKCSNPLFTSYYFMIVKRRGSRSRQLFTCFFCTRYCALEWLNEFQKNFYTVDWELCTN